jgi:hypothetical protein
VTNFTSTTAELPFVMQPALTLTANFYTNAPVINSQPKGMTNLQGQVAVFCVKATGAGLNYQWYAPTGAIAGATACSYTNSAVNFGDAGCYYAVVSNGGGTVTSGMATLAVEADTTAPTLAFTYPANNAQVTENNIIITGTASDKANASQVFVNFNNSGYQPAIVTNNPTAASVVWGLPFNLTAGSNQVSAYCVDTAGNVSKTNTRCFFFAVPATVTVNIVGDGTVGSTNLFDSVTASTLIGTNQFFVGRAYTLMETAAHDNLFSNWVDTTDDLISNTAKFTFTAETNFNVTANFVTNRFLGVAGTYHGLFSDLSEGVNETSAGWFTATVTPSDTKQSFSATLFVDGDSLSGISGTFGLNGGSSVVTVPRHGKASLTLGLNVNFDGTIGGTVINSGNWTSTASGDLATYSTLNPSPYAGTYNLLVPGFGNVADGPVGYSYLTVKVAAAGSVTASGSLADGTAISAIQTTAVDTNGDVPVYAKAYSYGFNTGTNIITSYAGALLGWLNVSNATPSGDLFWLKNATATNVYYSGGFNNESAVVGSIYTNTPTGLLITNGLVTFSGGDLTSNIFDNVSVSNAVVKIIGRTNDLKTLSFVPSSGAVSGTFTNTADVEPQAFKGLYLNLPGTNNIIGGYFLGTNYTGSLLVQP